jgi:hypothetical protein
MSDTEDTRTDDADEAPTNAPAEGADVATGMEPEQRHNFVMANRYSPERAAVMQAHYEANQASGRDANLAQQTPSLSGAVSMPIGEDQVPSVDVESMTVDQVEQFADEHPELVADILEAEQAREHPRSTLIEAMEKRQRAVEGSAEGQ